MSKTILVTGAAGFIGSHTAQQLVARGDSVIGLDNLNSYYDPARKRANLQEVASTQGSGTFHFIEGDIRDQATLAGIFGQQRVDAIVHLAGMAGVRDSLNDPQLYLDVNLSGTLNLLNSARDHSINNFVFASTSSVYGRTEVSPFIESDRCDRPLAPYPASKRAAELLGFTYHHIYQQNFTALRFFTVYGPRGRPDMMAYKILDNIFFGKEVPLYNAGQMQRDWTYVEDIAAGVIAAADRPLGYELINIGRGQPVLLADFVAMVERLTGQRARLIPAPMPDADMPSTYANIEKARQLLGYEPAVSVEQGVSRFWEWYQEAVLGS